MRIWSVLALLVAAPSLSRAQALPLDPEVKVGTLPNGFTYYLRRYPHPAGTAEMRLVVNAGVLHEDADQREFPHLLEHMAFNGSTHFPGDSFREFASKSGLAGGRNWNATTGSVTRYELSLPADRPEVYDSGFVIMRDWAQGLTLDPKQVDAERPVLIAENRGMGDSVELRMAQEMNSRLLNHHLYPLDSHQRTMANLRAGKQSALERFYRDWYRPDMQMLAVVGDIDVAQAEARIKALFSDMTMPAHPRSAKGLVERFAVPLSGANKYLTLFDADLSRISVRMYMKKPARSGDSPASEADYRSGLADDLYNRMMRNRLAQQTARYGVTPLSVDNTIDRRTVRKQAAIDALSTIIYFERSDDIEAGVRPMLAALAQLKRHGFLGSEFAQALTELREELSQPDETSASDLAVAYTMHFAEGAAALAPGETRALRLRLLDEIKLNDVNAMARDWIRTDRDFDVVFMAPASERAKVPSQRQFQAWIEEAQKAHVEPYVAPPVIEQLMSDAQVAALPEGVITKNSKIEDIGAVRLTLGNGITVILKPVRDPVLGANVELTAIRPGGISAYTGDDRASAGALSGVVDNTGIGPYDKFALKSFLDRHSMRGDVTAGDRMFSFDGVSPNTQLENLLQLTHLYFTTPRQDAVAFADWQQREQRKRSDGLSGSELFWRAQQDALFGAPLPMRGEVTAARVEAIYRDRFLQAGDFTFVLSGDFSVDAALPLIRKYVGSLSAARSTVSRDAQIVREPSLEPFSRTVRVGNEDNETIALRFSGRYTDSVINRLKLELLGEAIEARLHERLREKEGATYGVGVTPELTRPLGKETAFYSINVNFSAAVGESQRMLRIAQDEVARLGADGLDENLFTGVVDQLRTGPRMLLGIGTWDGYLTEQLLRNADLGETLKREAYLDHILTREELNAAAREYLGASVIQSFVRLPEARRARR